MVSDISIIEELEESISRGTSDKRVDALRKVTDLFLADAPRLSDDQVEIFDEVLGRLAVEIETRARAELSRRLAPVPNAPTEVINSLARDNSISVAGPVLTLSKRITDDVLVEVAQTKSQDHLLAIAGRSEIAPVVTDVLVERGNQAVVRWVAGNGGASFSDRGMAGLVDRSRDDDVLAEKVGLRSDISPEQFRSLMVTASERVQQQLMAANPGFFNASQLSSVLRSVSDRMGGDAAARPVRDYAAAQLVVGALARDNRLTEAELAGFARAGRFEETICALAALCKVPLQVVDRLVNGEHSDPVLILARASNFSWMTAKSVLLCRPGQAGTSTQAIEAAHTNFDKLSLATAQRVIRFWQVREASVR
jgi:uncharacterized protein (DUF2336 family)